MGSLKDRSSTNSTSIAISGSASSSSLQKESVQSSTEDLGPHSWWASFFLFLSSGVAWVVSIPLLLITLGGALQPHIGWTSGIVTAFCMFAVLVQVDQRIAAAVVFVVSFGSALTAIGGLPLFMAVAATWLTMLNARRKVCSPWPELLDFQCRHYGGYHKRSELRGDLDSIQPGRSFFACHPHGVLSVGWISNVVWGRQFHKTVGRCFYLIDGTLRNKGLLAKLFLDAYEGPHGGLRDTSRRTMEDLMEQGESLCMIPGAYQEATHFAHGCERVAIKQRRGFIKYCLKHGYRVHPVYTFGESDTYLTVGGCTKLRLWLNNWGIPTVVFWGLSWCPLLPRRGVELLTYVGVPLELPKIADPSPEEVEEWHGKYIVALKQLFDKYKAEAGKPNAQLEIL